MTARNEALAVTLTVAELRDVVDAAVDAALARRSASSSGDWIDGDTVASMCSVKRSTLPYLVKHAGLPHYRVGRLYTFRRSEVESWLEKRKSA